MKLTDFLRDRLPAFLISAAAWILALIFLFAFHVPAEAVVIVSVIVLLGAAAAELWVHEIKLPVAGLQLMCHNDGAQRYAEQLRRIDEYIENVLYYARSGSAEKDYIIKPVSLTRAFADIAVRNRCELQERGISLHTADLSAEVMTDGKWLEFMLGQLMSNSIKYGASEISVSAEELPDRTVLRFRDNGIGIPAGDLPYIFDKSFTGENGRTHTKSTGMGLYIVKKLCDRLGHSAEVSSVQGEFTEIALTFGKTELYKVE